METNELCVIFLTYVTTKKPIWFHPFPSSQSKVRDYVTIHYTVQNEDTKCQWLFSRKNPKEFQFSGKSGDKDFALLPFNINTSSMPLLLSIIDKNVIFSDSINFKDDSSSCFQMISLNFLNTGLETLDLNIILLDISYRSLLFKIVLPCRQSHLDILIWYGNYEGTFT